MTIRRKTKKALAMLLPAGVLGISSALASVPSELLPKETMSSTERTTAVGDRLREIRGGVSELNALAQKLSEAETDVLTVAWFNAGFGWRNGGWGNGGWHNWGNGGWHNAAPNWGNGGWHNAPNWGNGGGNGWPNGWHNAPNWGNGGGWRNGWHNFWHNG